MSIQSAKAITLALATSVASVGCIAVDSTADENAGQTSSAVVLETNYLGSSMDRFSYNSGLGQLESLVYAAPGCRVGEAGGTCPVIIFHHGDGQTGGVQNQFSDGYDIPSLIKGGYHPAGLIIAAPSRFAGWVNGRIADFSVIQLALLKEMQSAYKVNTRAVHVTGLSGGSSATVALVEKYPGSVASWSLFDGMDVLEPCQTSDTSNCLAPQDVASVTKIPTFLGTGWGDPIGGVGSEDNIVQFLTSHGDPASNIQEYVYCSSGVVARDAQVDWQTRVAWDKDGDPQFCGKGVGHAGWHFGYSTVQGAPHNPTWWDWVRSTFPTDSTSTGSGSTGSGSTGGSVTTGGTAPSKSIPGLIEAESYDAMSGVQLEKTGDVSGGSNVGWVDAGDSMDYDVNVAAAGVYALALRVASTSAGQIQIRNEAGAVLDTVDLPVTGGWQTWTTVQSSVALTAGNQVLRIYASKPGWNLNWFSLSPTNGGKSIPGKIEAEDYDAMSGIAVEGTADSGGTSDVGWVDAGDSMDYDVDVQTAGVYPVSLRIASTSAGQIELRNAAGALLTTVSLPVTGGWQTWTTVQTTVSLPAGSQTLTVRAAKPGWNLNWMSFGLTQ